MLDLQKDLDIFVSYQNIWLKFSPCLKARKPIVQTFSFDDDDLSDLFDDADIDFDVTDKKKNNGFIVLMRLSPIPEYLVQGYDFKLLNKYSFFSWSLWEKVTRVNGLMMSDDEEVLIRFFNHFGADELEPTH